MIDMIDSRLCTATAAAAMRESFGCDGQPGSYTDIDYCDCIFIVGHNIAATQTVLWTRMLDRLAGPDPPKVVVMDPRSTSTAQAATVHIAPRIGTNVAVLNGLLNLLFEHPTAVDKEYTEKHTIGVGLLVLQCCFSILIRTHQMENLRATVSHYSPEYVEQLSGVLAATLRAAAEVLGSCKRLLSTALQGVYQSNQATAAACQINSKLVHYIHRNHHSHYLTDINLIRGMIGKEGAGVYQMNGQPTAQNNRETGCDGEYPGFRNPQNPDHMADLARHWNVDVNKVPHWSQPTPVMDLLSYIENGTIQFLWISGTNPAVSLPEIERVRQLLTKKDLFVIAQDIFPTETTQLADVVLPAAMWAEKTGCYVSRLQYTSRPQVPTLTGYTDECRSHRAHLAQSD
jgi:ferredoxin-nitrate reductase